MKVPVMLLKSSPARWIEVPLPELAMFIRPGLARSARIRLGMSVTL
jgi:hypothetical protein